MNWAVRRSAARTHRSELTGSIVRRRRNPLALARGGGQGKYLWSRLGNEHVRLSTAEAVSLLMQLTRTVYVWVLA